MAENTPPGIKKKLFVIGGIVLVVVLILIAL